MRKRRHWTLHTVAVLTSTLILHCGEARAEWPWNPFDRHARRGTQSPGLCVGGTIGSLQHLRGIATLIKTMSIPCLSEKADTETEYVILVQPTTRVVLYSFSHSALSVSDSPDLSQHIFRGLGLVSFTDFSGVPPTKRVQPSSFEGRCFSYRFVFVNACHSGDEAPGGFLDRESKGSAAGDLLLKFPNAVYMAARGGNNGYPILSSCTKCLGQTTAQNDATALFTIIHDERAAGRNPSFAEIKRIWDPENNPDAEHSRYVIMRGRDTSIRTVFP